jgi:tRNA threonylcarbamoyladenosine biosynthesis protein TsaB
MPLILAIESSTEVCSVSLFRGQGLLGSTELQQSNVHAHKMSIIIDQLITHTGIDLADLNAVAVNGGPGSYTGLRIGVSIAKGLAYALSIPLIAVDALEGLAYQALPFIGENDFVIPLMDARRMEVYMAIYGYGGQVLEKSQPLVLDHNPFDTYLDKGKVYFVGDGVEKSKNVLAHPNARFLQVGCTSRSVAAIAMDRFNEGIFEDIAYYEPNYLKEFRVIQSQKNPLSI